MKEKIAGDRVKALLVALNMTQRELSIILGCDASLISAWINNRNRTMTDTGYVEKFLKLEAKGKTESRDSKED